MVASLPAGMARLDNGIHGLAGVTYFEPAFDYTTARGESGSTITEPIVGPHAFGVYRLEGDFAVGLGQYFPFNVDNEYPANWEGRSQLTREKLVIGYTSLTGAYAINEDFSVGAAVNFISAWAQLQQTLIVAPGTDIPLVLGGTGETTGYAASFLYQSDFLTVAVSHAPGYSVNIEGNVTFDTTAAPGLTPSFPDGKGSVELNLPAVTEVGVGIRGGRQDPDYSLEVNVVRTAWSTYKELVIRFDSGLPAPTSTLERNWKDTTGIKVGGNYVLARSGDASHKIRAGYYADENASPPETLDPAVPDGAGRDEYAVGYGYKRGDFLLDAAYFVVRFKDSSTSPDNPLPASYGGEVVITAVSVGLKF